MAHSRLLLAQAAAAAAQHEALTRAVPRPKIIIINNNNNNNAKQSKAKQLSTSRSTDNTRARHRWAGVAITIHDGRQDADAVSEIWGVGR